MSVYERDEETLHSSAIPESRESKERVKRENSEIRIFLKTNRIGRFDCSYKRRLFKVYQNTKIRTPERFFFFPPGEQFVE